MSPPDQVLANILMTVKKEMASKRSLQREDEDSSRTSCVSKDDKNPKRIKLDDSNTEFSEDGLADIIDYILQ